MIFSSQERDIGVEALQDSRLMFLGAGPWCHRTLRKNQGHADVDLPRDQTCFDFNFAREQFMNRAFICDLEQALFLLFC
jgi:hypothetical protein